MKAAQGHLNDVIRFSAVDGPGNRFVVFLQGCNFNCIACHNPYTINDCDSCGVCVEPCPEMALWFDGHHRVVVDDDVCTQCDICIQVCPRDSTPLSQMIRLDSLTRQIDEVSPFISGITVSGGEPTLQADFVTSLFSAIKCDGKLSRLTTFVDSNGHAGRDVWDRLLPVMDGAMIDLKALDPDTHREMTGSGNELVLETIRYLAEWDRLYEVRLLMVPGKNDSPEAVAATARWLYDVDPAMRVKLIGFRQHGVRPQFADIPEADPDHMAELADILRTTGFADLLVV
ncbi:MAG: YjjW family glycine radical enzyme activase [Acidimicrobiia bacterium]|nr:YjjW family glycine radical enzyme activase [Acidimicrobiia bacterium]